ncbi:MAG: hypothetical protein AB4372_15315 [Xenococcus sp. (in: cyanobacteria)]
MTVSRRLIKNRGHKQTVGNFSSCKMKTGVWYDSALKRDFMYWLEFDPDVVSYTTPAISFNFYESGKLQQYIPDFQVIRCRKKQIIDVKSRKTLQGNQYKRRYQQLTSICNNTGWTFVALSELEVRKEPIFSNIKLLYRYARESFSIDQYRDCLEVVRSQVPTSLANIYQILDCHKIPRNILLKLIFCCSVEIDLKQPIQLDSQIAAVSEKIDWERLLNV